MSARHIKNCLKKSFSPVKKSGERHSKRKKQQNCRVQNYLAIRRLSTNPMSLKYRVGVGSSQASGKRSWEQIVKENFWHTITFIL